MFMHFEIRKNPSNGAVSIMPHPVNNLAAKYTKVAYFGSLFAMKGLYPELFQGSSRVLWAPHEPGCHPVQVCITVTTTILFI